MMHAPHIFDFDAQETDVAFPEALNNPFGGPIPEIAQLAAREFQSFISAASADWEHDFRSDKGKMFGVLVVQKQDKSFGYLGTVSGKLQGDSYCEQFIPSVFDESADDYFINRGMKSLTEMSRQIKASDNSNEVRTLKVQRKQKSTALQQRLFEHYHFMNSAGEMKNVLQIFEQSSQGKPPSAVGECAAPKLLQYAFEHHLKPVALAEFWWGLSDSQEKRKHANFYPACKEKCRPILEYMLDDKGLFHRVSLNEEGN